MEKMTILAGSVERAGSFVPTIIVNGDGRYFASESPPPCLSFPYPRDKNRGFTKWMPLRKSLVVPQQ